MQFIIFLCVCVCCFWPSFLLYNTFLSISLSSIACFLFDMVCHFVLLMYVVFVGVSLFLCGLVGVKTFHQNCLLWQQEVMFTMQSHNKQILTLNSNTLEYLLKMTLPLKTPFLLMHNSVTLRLDPPFPKTTSILLYHPNIQSRTTQTTRRWRRKEREMDGPFSVKFCQTPWIPFRATYRCHIIRLQEMIPGAETSTPSCQHTKHSRSLLVNLIHLHKKSSISVGCFFFSFKKTLSL